MAGDSSRDPPGQAFDLSAENDEPAAPLALAAADLAAPLAAPAGLPSARLAIDEI